jgi:hypothetical protein
MENLVYKQALLNIGEDSAMRLVKEVIRPMAEQYIRDSENEIDDIILPFLGMIEAQLLSLIDRIDGEVDL